MLPLTIPPEISVGSDESEKVYLFNVLPASLSDISLTAPMPVGPLSIVIFICVFVAFGVLSPIVQEAKDKSIITAMIKAEIFLIFKMITS